MIEGVIDYAFNYKGNFVLHGLNHDGLHEVNTHEPNGALLESKILENEVIKKGKLWGISDKAIAALGGLTLLASISHYVISIPSNDYTPVFAFIILPIYLAASMVSESRRKYENLNILNLKLNKLKKI